LVDALSVLFAHTLQFYFDGLMDLHLRLLCFIGRPCALKEKQKSGQNFVFYFFLALLFHLRRLLAHMRDFAALSPPCARRLSSTDWNLGPAFGRINQC
jgi:hypothetical protein